MIVDTKKVLLQKADEFSGALQKNGLSSELVKSSLGQYSIKIKADKDIPGFIVLTCSGKGDNLKYHLENIKEERYIKNIDQSWSDLYNLSTNNLSIEIDNKISIYVDGSFQSNLGSFAFIVVQNGKELYSRAGLVEDKYLSSHQVGGEIKAVEEALTWCKEKGIFEVYLFYDFQNLEKWAIGEFKTNKDITRNFSEFVNSTNIKIIWNKVVSHTGNYFNERADQIAKDVINKATSNVSNKMSSATSIKKIVSELKDIFKKHNIIIKKIVKPPSATPSYKLSLVNEKIDIGFLWLYEYKDGSIQPKYHALKSNEAKALIKKLWELSTGDEIFESAPGTKNDSAVNYYYQVFKKYEKYQFDFLKLAESIAAELPQKADEILGLRFNFPSLEQYYLQISKEG